MTLHLYNTLTRRKEPFEPIEPGKARMYVCGITAYDLAHIGHARAAVTFDVIARHLRRHFALTYARNYTDVDDKIIARAQKEGVDPQALAQRFIVAYEEDMQRLNVLPPDITPKATEHIPQMITLAEELIATKHAYALDGDVYFSVRSFPAYGKLSGKNVDDLESGARVEVDERKKDPLDFALWKSAKAGEPAWESPWGAGRPGWHIECSAMSAEYLGQPFDIHGGGRDLIFPHHENEIAQSEAAHGREFARYWLHNGFVNINAEKMSKSLGNFTTVRDVLTLYDAEVLRLFLLSGHYRSPLDYTEDNMRDADRTLLRLYSAKRALAAMSEDVSSAPTATFESLRAQIAQLTTRVNEAMDDDFNTPKVLAAVFELLRECNQQLVKPKPPAGAGKVAAEFIEALNEVSDVMGIFGSDAVEYLDRQRMLWAARGIDVAAIDALVAERATARAAKDFARSDAIREQLAALNVEVKDGVVGTEWLLK